MSVPHPHSRTHTHISLSHAVLHLPTPTQPQEMQFLQHPLKSTGVPPPMHVKVSLWSPPRVRAVMEANNQDAPSSKVSCEDT